MFFDDDDAPSIFGMEDELYADWDNACGDVVPKTDETIPRTDESVPATDPEQPVVVGPPEAAPFGEREERLAVDTVVEAFDTHFFRLEYMFKPLSFDTDFATVFFSKRGVHRKDTIQINSAALRSLVKKLMERYPHYVSYMFVMWATAFERELIGPTDLCQKCLDAWEAQKGEPEKFLYFSNQKGTKGALNAVKILMRFAEMPCFRPTFYEKNGDLKKVHGFVNKWDYFVLPSFTYCLVLVARFSDGHERCTEVPIVAIQPINDERRFMVCLTKLHYGENTEDLQFPPHLFRNTLEERMLLDEFISMFSFCFSRL